MAEGTGIVKKTGLYWADPRSLVARDGWNCRSDYGDIDALAKSIMENGVINPLHVHRNGDGDLIVDDGHRRLKATIKAIDELDAVIEAVPILVKRKGMSEAEQMFTQLISNDGKPLAPSEESEAFRRLTGYGLSQSEICKRVGRTAYYVGSRLALVDAVPDLRKAVDAGEVPIRDAVKIVKGSDGDMDVQREAAEAAKKTAAKRKADAPKKAKLCSMVKAREEVFKQLRRFDPKDLPKKKAERDEALSAMLDAATDIIESVESFKIDLGEIMK